MPRFFNNLKEVKGIKKALLVIDMQNVYLPGSDWECENIINTIKYIKAMIKKFDKSQIFFTKFIHNEHADGMWAEYNKKYFDINSNAYLNDYVVELKKYINDDNLYLKHTFSSLKNKKLFLKLKEFDKIYVTGVMAECCILATIFELIDMGKKVVYCKKGIAGVNKEKEQSVIKILEDLSPIHIEFE